MGREENQACVGAHLAAENQHDMAGTLATLHPECVFVDEALGMRWEGHAGARRHYEMWWSAFGVTPEDGTLHWSSDDLAIGEAVFAGRHVGRFADIEPTGRPLRLPFVVFVRFRDGLLAGERFVYDLNTLLRQLGQPAFDPTDGWSLLVVELLGDGTRRFTTLCGEIEDIGPRMCPLPEQSAAVRRCHRPGRTP
jgi:ketosteroid isomerase-like protein